MEVPYGEDVASHIGPESCVGIMRSRSDGCTYPSRMADSDGWPTDSLSPARTAPTGPDGVFGTRQSNSPVCVDRRVERRMPGPDCRDPGRDLRPILAGLLVAVLQSDRARRNRFDRSGRHETQDQDS